MGKLEHEEGWEGRIERKYEEEQLTLKAFGKAMWKSTTMEAP